MNRIKNNGERIKKSPKTENVTLTKDMDFWKEKNWYFHHELMKVFKRYVEEDSNILQIGYGVGDILSYLYPKRAVSVNYDRELAKISQRRYPAMTFVNSLFEETHLKQKFDYIILPNTIDHVYDIQTVFEKAQSVMQRKAKIIATFANPRWEKLFAIAERYHLKRPETKRNWVRLQDVQNIIENTNFAIIDSGYEIALPFHIPLISSLFNTIAQKSRLLAPFSVEQYVVAEPVPQSKREKLYSCTVVIPCYNEEENIAKAIETVPKMGKWTEILVVDDGSTDKTASIVKSIMKKNKKVRLITYKPNHGKGYAVKRGFDESKGDIIMIQDADMTVPPEELPRFFNLLASKGAGFANGTRLIYPMESQAMRQLNLMGNVVFGKVFSYILGQRITDTLCGTKAIYKKDYKKIPMSAKGWGDFDLLFGAAENELIIKEVPVHYKERVAGKSKMKVFKHGMVMAQMAAEGFWRLRVKKKIRESFTFFSQSKMLREKRGIEVGVDR